jgi:carbon monoxide dehydrogenase subunit G
MRRALAIRLAATVVLPALLSACGGVVLDRGETRSEDREIGPVTAVDLATSGSLRLSTGDAPSLEITAGENVLEHLTSEVSGDRLVLDTDGSFGNLGDVRYTLVLPGARELELSGSGAVRVEAPSGLTRVSLSGSGDVRIEGLAGDQLTVDLSGSGRITAAGEVGSQVLSLDGSGEYDARDLDSEQAEVTIGGSGTAQVTVSDTLHAVIEGSGTITYAGGATVQSEIEGSGTVTER